MKQNIGDYNVELLQRYIESYTPYDSRHLICTDTFFSKDNIEAAIPFVIPAKAGIQKNDPLSSCLGRRRPTLPSHTNNNEIAISATFPRNDGVDLIPAFAGMTELSAGIAVEAAILTNWTSCLSIETKKKVIERLYKVHPLWSVEHNHLRTKDGLEFVSLLFETSTEEELAFHDILYKLAKTSTEHALLVAINNLCEANDDETLQDLLQHVSPSIIRRIISVMEMPNSAKVDAISKRTIAVRASNIYDTVDQKQVSATDVMNDKQLDENLVYLFCKGAKLDPELLKVYQYALAGNEPLLDLLLKYSTADQLEMIFDKLPTLKGNVISELKYRIGNGISRSIHGSDVLRAIKIWNKRFARLDQERCKEREEILSTNVIPASYNVIPAKAGIQEIAQYTMPCIGDKRLDPRLRGNDTNGGVDETCIRICADIIFEASRHNKSATVEALKSINFFGILKLLKVENHSDFIYEITPQNIDTSKVFAEKMIKKLAISLSIEDIMNILAFTDNDMVKLVMNAELKSRNMQEKHGIIDYITKIFRG